MWRAKLRRGTCESAVKGNPSPLGMRLRVFQVSRGRDPVLPAPCCSRLGALFGGSGLSEPRLGEPRAADSAPGARVIAAGILLSYPDFFFLKSRTPSPRHPVGPQRQRVGSQRPVAPRPLQHREVVSARGARDPGCGRARTRGPAFPEGPCHMAALSETRPRPGLPAAEGGGGKGVAGGRFPPRETKARTPAGPTGCALPA